MKENEKQNRPTLFEIIKENPDMTYNEASKIQGDTRLRNEESAAAAKEVGACITSGMKRDREATDKMKNRQQEVTELNIRIAELLQIDEAHQKQMGKLQERLTEVEEDNKKLAHQVENLKLNHVRKAGL